MEFNVVSEGKRNKRCNGQGNLKKRGNVWWARWTYHGVSYERSTKVRVDLVDDKGNPCGKAVAEKVLEGFLAPFRLKDEGDVAAVFLNRMNRSRTEEETIGDNGKKTLELKDLGEAFKASTRRNDITQQHLNSYVAIANEFAKFAGKNTSASAITDKTTSAWADKIWKDNIAPHTFNGKISSMRQIWDVLAPRIGCKDNPWIGIKKKKNDTQTRRPPTDEEITKIKKAAGERYGGDILMLITIGENTGMRIGDCSMLTWDDVDFKSSMIRVITEKTGARVSIPMLQEFRKTLEERKKTLLRQCKEADAVGWDRYWNSLPAANQKERDANKVVKKFRNYVCPRMAERHVREKTLLPTLIRKVIQKAGLKTSVETKRGVKARPVLSFHSFRHAFVSKLKMSGVSVQAAMELVGHKSKEINEHYTHINEEFLSGEMKKLQK